LVLGVERHNAGTWILLGPSLGPLGWARGKPSLDIGLPIDARIRTKQESARKAFLFNPSFQGDVIRYNPASFKVAEAK